MHYMQFPNTQMIECVINPSNALTIAKNPFGQEQQLQNRKIVGIEALSNQDCTNSPISSNNLVITKPIFNNSYLSLYTSAIAGQREGLYYDQIPLSRLRTVQNMDATAANATSGARDVFMLRPTEISWGQKSYIYIPVPVTCAATYSALLLVHYLDQGDPGFEWEPGYFPGMPIPQEYRAFYQNKYGSKFQGL